MPERQKQLQNAGLLKRLAAMLYDTLLLLAVLFIATAVVLPFSAGKAMQPNNPLYTSYLFITAFFFYAWFWVHGGQTLGMRAWKLQLRRIDGGTISWWHALLRFMAAIPSWALLGLGYWWMILDKQKLAWHDRFSETTVIQLDENPHRN